jgi:hypothetical protein
MFSSSNDESVFREGIFEISERKGRFSLPVISLILSPSILMIPTLPVRLSSADRIS